MRRLALLLLVTACGTPAAPAVEPARHVSSPSAMAPDARLPPDAPSMPASPDDRVDYYFCAGGEQTLDLMRRCEARGSGCRITSCGAMAEVGQCACVCGTRSPCPPTSDD